MSYFLKKFLPLAFLVSYIVVAFFQMKNAHPFVLIHTAVYSNWEYSDSRILPFPFRDSVAKKILSNLSMDDLKLTPNFPLNLYSVLAIKDYDYFVESIHQPKLESLADIFLSKGLNINERNRDGCTALQQAIIASDNAGVQYLLSKGASTDFSYDASKDKRSNLCGIKYEVLINTFLQKSANSGDSLLISN